MGTTAWEQLIGLYPYLVECTTTSSAEVSRSLREALLQYCDLLRPPASALALGSPESPTTQRLDNNNDVANNVANGISHC